MPSAITIIRDEHRALAAVLRGLQYLVEQIRNGQQSPDFPLLKSMLAYIEAFPDKLHHPKEDQYIYPVLRQRDPSAAPTLDVLEDEHRRGPGYLNKLQDTLDDYQRDSEKFAAFAEAVSNYAGYQWAHMNKEEDVILPLAEKALL
ncbi:MAG: hemerythrin domain-containing protein, partial [Caldilineaceae bacterium]|nr:hemerythrin domain-containing protein [Caldilineaceae bacterium]